MLKFVAIISSLSILCGCGTINSGNSKDVSKPSNFASNTDTENTSGNIILREDLSGTLYKTVMVEENSALIAINFTYMSDEKHYEIQNILDAHAELIEGWEYVEDDVLIDFQNIIFSRENAKASVPIIYYASIGVGLASYTDVVLIDLTACTE